MANKKTQTHRVPAQQFDRQHLIAANINPDSYLATDYLNHFNEIIMLLEMLEMMPEMADEVLDWQPKSYEQHFAQSEFTEKNLAIAAYAHAPQPLRAHFERIVQNLDRQVSEIQSLLRATLKGPDAQLCASINTIVVAALRTGIARANAIIHGDDSDADDLSQGQPASAQEVIDAVLSRSNK